MHKSARANLPRRTIEVLSRIHVPLQAVTEMDYRVNVEGYAPEQAAAQWMEAHRATVQAWMESGER